MTQQPQQALTVVSPGQHVVARAGQWSKREAQLISQVIAPNLSELELHVFSRICQHTGLDPFKKQIYAWPEKGGMTIHIAINGWRALAARTGVYAGQTPTQWCGQDGVWRDVWLDEGPPAAARVGVYRKGAAEPIYAVVTWREFERTQARTRAKAPTVWDEKGPHMLGVRAEYHALQKACPEAYERTLGEAAAANVTISAVDESEVPDLPADAMRPLLEEATDDEDEPMVEGESRDIAEEPPVPVQPQQDPPEAEVAKVAAQAAAQTPMEPPFGDGPEPDEPLPAAQPAAPAPAPAEPAGPDPRFVNLAKTLGDEMKLAEIGTDVLTAYLGGGTLGFAKTWLTEHPKASVADLVQAAKLQ